MVCVKPDISFQGAGEGYVALRGHLLANNISETVHSAYRAHHGTETALLDVSNFLLGNVGEGRVSILTLIDLSAAFDTLDHIILLTRLHDMFGISGKGFEWFSLTGLKAPTN